MGSVPESPRILPHMDLRTLSLLRIGGVACMLWLFAGCRPANQSPNNPATPTGPTVVLVDSTVSFVSSATDPDQDSVYVGFNLRLLGKTPSDNADWSSLVAAGDTVGKQYHFNGAGTYLLRTRALDVHGSYSDWSAELVFTVWNGRLHGVPVRPEMKEELR